MAVQEERREYFRIDDDIHLNVKVIGEEAYQEMAAKPEEEWAGPPSVVVQLASLTAQAGNMLASIRKNNPEVGHYLALLDKKVDLVAQAVEGSRSPEANAPNTRANIGAGGLSFRSKSALDPQTRMEVEITLFPSRIRVHAYGTVVYCRDESATHPRRPQRIGVEFTLIATDQREILIRHVLARQSALLRKSRGEE